MEQRKTGIIEQRITDKLVEGLRPTSLNVINESYMHNVPPGSETHFKVVAVAEDFAGTRRVGRHRLIHKILATELANDIHALSIEAFTPAEWEQKNGAVTPSPQCLGGSKGDPEFKA